MKYVNIMAISLILVGCSTVLPKSEVAKKIGIDEKSINLVSKCSFTITALTNTRGEWQACTLVESDDTFGVISEGSVALKLDFRKIKSAMLVKNYARHFVQLEIENATVAIQIAKEYDLVDEQGVLSLFDRLKRKGVPILIDGNKVENDKFL